MAKNFTTGFITGLGGLITLPISIPAALGATWVIQARMVATIAAIYGHNLSNDRVKTMIILSILGDKMKSVLKEAGVQVTTRLGLAAIQQIPGKVLIEINKQVGFRLVTKAGETGVINLASTVAVVGGVFAGGIDAAFCRKVGAIAKETFSPQKRHQTEAA